MSTYSQSSVNYSIGLTAFDDSDSNSNYSDSPDSLEDKSSSDEEIVYITEQEINSYKAISTHVANNCVQDSIRKLPFIEPPNKNNRTSLKKVLWPLKPTHLPSKTNLFDSIAQEIETQKKIQLSSENSLVLAEKIHKKVELVLQAMTDELQVYS
jgi:hypothetical protein